MFEIFKRRKKTPMVKKDFVVIRLPLTTGEDIPVIVEGTPEKIRTVAQHPLLAFMDSTGKLPTKKEVLESCGVDLEKYDRRLRIGEFPHLKSAW